MAKRSSITEALDEIAEELERCKWKRNGTSSNKTSRSNRITTALDKIAGKVKQAGERTVPD